jgi:hypothetical protein
VNVAFKKKSQEDLGEVTVDGVDEVIRSENGVELRKGPHTVASIEPDDVEMLVIDGRDVTDQIPLAGGTYVYKFEVFKFEAKK